jgi:hypothetical protein
MSCSRRNRRPCPTAITPQLGQPVSAGCDSTVKQSPAATLLPWFRQAASNTCTLGMLNIASTRAQ